MANNKSNIFIIIGIIALLVIGTKFLNFSGTQAVVGVANTVTRNIPRTTVYTNKPFEVDLFVNPGTSSYYYIDEVLPSGLTVSTTGGGDATTRPPHMFWAVTSGVTATTINYTLIATTAGTYTWPNSAGSGFIFEGSNESLILGDKTITVTACTSSAEICDNIDNDCNYVIDNGLTKSTSCGVGACVNTVTQTCSAGAWVGTCTPKASNTAADTGCDGHVDLSELASYTTLWKQGTVNLSQLAAATSAWKAG